MREAKLAWSADHSSLGLEVVEVEASRRHHRDHGVLQVLVDEVTESEHIDGPQTASVMPQVEDLDQLVTPGGVPPN